MRITIVGRARAITNKETRLAMRWFAQKLMSTKLSNNIHIRVVFRLNPKDAGDGSLVTGAVKPTDDKNRRFVMILEREMSRRKALRTIAHEMVHLRDFATGRLVSEYRGDTTFEKWCGEIIPSDVDYYDQPSEIEAYGREEGLYRRYCQYVKCLNTDSE